MDHEGSVALGIVGALAVPDLYNAGGEHRRERPSLERVDHGGVVRLRTVTVLDRRLIGCLIGVLIVAARLLVRFGRDPEETLHIPEITGPPAPGVAHHPLDVM